MLCFRWLVPISPRVWCFDFFPSLTRNIRTISWQSLVGVQLDLSWNLHTGCCTRTWRWWSYTWWSLNSDCKCVKTWSQRVGVRMLIGCVCLTWSTCVTVRSIEQRSSDVCNSRLRTDRSSSRRHLTADTVRLGLWRAMLTTRMTLSVRPSVCFRSTR